MRKSLTAAVLAVGIVMCPTFARAADDSNCGEKTPRIVVQLADVTPDVRARILSELRSSISARHIEVCVSDDPAVQQPLATLEVRPIDTETIATTIVLNDGLTRKRIVRDLDLHGIPEDGRALAIALALDELLRASWAEMILPDARPPAPPPIPAPPPPPPAPARPDAWYLGAAVAGEHFGGRQDQLGPDIFGGYVLRSRLALALRLGLRAGLAQDSAGGTIRSTATNGGASASFALFPPQARAAGADATTSLLVTRLSFVGEPNPGYRGSEVSAVAVYLTLGARGWLALGKSFRCFLEIAGGVPLHTVSVVETGTRIAGLSGPLISTALGASWHF